MIPFQSNVSPGVYVKEIDLSQRVAQVSSSIGAIVAPFECGPVNERTLITTRQQFLSTFGKHNPRRTKASYCALEFLNKATRLYVTRVVNDNATANKPLTAGCYCTIEPNLDSVAKPNVSLSYFDAGSASNTPKGIYDPMNTLGFSPSDPSVDKQLFFIACANPGTWNNGIMIRIRSSKKPNADWNSAFDDPTDFFIDVFTNYENVRSAPDESFLVSRKRKVDGYGNQMYIEEVINSKSSIIRVKNNEYAPEVGIYNDSSVFLDGGTVGDQVTASQIIRGWELYSDPEAVDINIMIQAGMPSGNTDLYDAADVQSAMLEIAQDRMDSIAVLDIPDSEQVPADAINYRRNILNASSSYGAIYTPNVKVYDEFNDRKISVPPSGHAAAAMAYTDSVAELWFAPAGMFRGRLNISGADHIYTQGERNAMTDAQINYIRFFPNGSGYKIWEATTLQTEASARSYVNIRRLLNYLEKSLAIAQQYSVFEPNDEILWNKLYDICDRFLKPIKRGRGVYWYEIVCDERVNTPEVIATGDTIVNVFVDPVIMAKRINLNAHIMKTGNRTRFTESAS